MGYSYNALAGFAMDKVTKDLGCGNNGLPSNTFESKGNKYFYEHGREQRDGAITGIVWKFVGGETVRKAGSFRIEPNGIVTRFPGTTKKMRRSAAIEAVATYIQTYNRRPTVSEKHPAYHLATASFAVV